MQIHSPEIVDQYVARVEKGLQPKIAVLSRHVRGGHWRSGKRTIALAAQQPVAQLPHSAKVLDVGVRRTPDLL